MVLYNCGQNGAPGWSGSLEPFHASTMFINRASPHRLVSDPPTDRHRHDLPRRHQSCQQVSQNVGCEVGKPPKIVPRNARCPARAITKANVVASGTSSGRCSSQAWKEGRCMKVFMILGTLPGAVEGHSMAVPVHRAGHAEADYYNHGQGARLPLDSQVDAVFAQVVVVIRLGAAILFGTTGGPPRGNVAPRQPPPYDRVVPCLEQGDERCGCVGRCQAGRTLDEEHGNEGETTPCSSGRRTCLEPDDDGCGGRR